MYHNNALKYGVSKKRKTLIDSGQARQIQRLEIYVFCGREELKLINGTRKDN